jgi:tRNA threonylcarbamoyladenosine biosynthesis protein TsaB
VIVLGFDTATAATAVGLLASDGHGHGPGDGAERRHDPAPPGDGGGHDPGDGAERRHDPAPPGDGPGDGAERHDPAPPGPGHGPGDGAERRYDPAPGERPGHAPRLLALAHELLADAGLTFADVRRIAVGVGPGGFTGLRIGVSTARALAQASGAEIVGVSTLHALAAGARPAAGQGVLAVVDARRGEVFAGGWRGGAQVLGPLAVKPAEVGALDVAGWLAVGDGALRFRDDLKGAGCVVPADGSPQHGVSGLAVCRLGLAARRGTRRELVVPDYLRKPDAVRRDPKP